tara:strand:- start:97 stop:837 length:741 start_codon:yes stop_codon:yes gene_type:complete
MINHEHKFIFLHIPKCAGTSIGYTLNTILGIGDPRQVDDEYGGFKVHHDILTKEMLEEYFVFTFVRNPWSRLVSNYTYRKEIYTKFTFDEFARNMLRSFADGLGYPYIPSYIPMWEDREKSFWKEESHEGLDFIPKWDVLMNDYQKMIDYFSEFICIPSQLDFLRGKYSFGLDRLPYVDFFGKVENIQDDFDTICQRLGVSNKKVKIRNNSIDRVKPYWNYYDDDLREFVYKQFKEDIDHFDYKWR